MLLRMTQTAKRVEARLERFNEAGAMLLRMTVPAAVRSPSVPRFNEAGAMLLRMTLKKLSRLAVRLNASMRPEQCCSG